MKGVILGIVLFVLTCATALLMWVNWDNIVDHFDNLINPETQEEQTDDTQNEDDVLEQNGITMIELN